MAPRPLARGCEVWSMTVSKNRPLSDSANQIISNRYSRPPVKWWVWLLPVYLLLFVNIILQLVPKA